MSECYFWSFRDVSCLANSSRLLFVDNFYDAFFQHRLVRNNGFRLRVPKFVLVLRTSEFSTLRFAQVFNEFDNSLSSVSVYL